jgi:hypothetical protein
VNIFGDGVTSNVVAGNLIGTDVTGTKPLGNLLDGVHFQENASNNTIGGPAAGAGNLIAFNGGNGVTVGAAATDDCNGDAILGNSIVANAKLGIDLGNDGVTLNDSMGHSGPNLFQDFPVLTSALTFNGSTTITGTLSGSPGTTYRVEFFSNAAADPSGYGQGQTFLTFADVTAGPSGTASFTVETPSPVSIGQFITATATDPTGNTSEFSADLMNSPLGVTSLTGVAPNPRNTPVWTVDVTFSEPVNLATFTPSDLSLTDNGGPNLVSGAVTISLVSG